MITTSKRMFYYITMLFNFFKTRQALHLNISFETPGDQRSATVIYSSSTRQQKFNFKE